MLGELAPGKRRTVGGNKGFDSVGFVPAAANWLSLRTSLRLVSPAGLRHRWPHILRAQLSLVCGDYVCQTACSLNRIDDGTFSDKAHSEATPQNVCALSRQTAHAIVQ